MKITCKRCGAKINEETAITIGGFNNFICFDCYNSNCLTECDDCRENFIKEYLYEVHGNRLVCSDCFDNYIKCDDCDEYVLADDSFYTANENNICRSCYENDYFYCDSCERVLHTDLYGLDGCCEDCCEHEEEYSEYIHEYNYNPLCLYNKEIHNALNSFPKKPYLGVELEVSVKEDLCETAESVHEILGDFCILKKDGSIIDSGFEICSLPLVCEDHKKSEAWERFFDYAPCAIRTESYRKNCGMHIHINRKSFSHVALTRFIAFIHSSTNKDFVEKIAERKSNMFCRFTAKNPILHEYGEKYEAVALHKKETIEVRIFASVVDKESFFKNIEFVAALREFCFRNKSDFDYKDEYPKTKELVVFNSLHWHNFVSFVEKKKEQYPYLSQFIAKFCTVAAE